MNLRSILASGGAAGAIALALAATPALAQPTTTNGPEDDTAVAPEQTIIVTGTRSTTRTVENSPVPVDVLSSETLNETGQVETNKILNKLVPSFNFPQPSIADGTDAIKPATLRGLAPDQTLVLVNGKRRHTSALLNINGTIGRGSAAVDLNSIPALAIERIEVLRDGASSQYGSDAIAGVINIRLKTADSGGRAVASFGKYVTTLDDVQRVTGLQTNAAGSPFIDPSVATAPAGNRFFAANTDGELKVRDGQTYTVASNIGLPFFGTDGGYLNLTAEYRHRDRTNRTGFDLRPNYTSSTAAAFDPRELTFDRREFRFGDPKADDFTLFLNAAFPLTEVWEAYVFASMNQRDSVSAANYRQAANANNVDYSQLAPTQAPPAINPPRLTPDGFLPLIKSDLTDYAYTAGFRGEVLGGWRADLSAGYGSNQFDYTVQNSVNASFGSATQRSFDSGGLKYSQGLLNLDLSRDFEMGLAKPLTVSVGGEYRNERYQIRPGDFQSYALGPFFRAAITNTTAANCAAQQGVFAGTTCTFPGRQGGAGAQGFPGLPANAATDAGRHNFAGYAELDTDLLDRLSLTAAGRFEHYSDFGDTVTGKLAARFEVFDGFALRGSVSNGFRAPSLHQQVFTTTSTNFVSGVPVDILTLPVSNPIARALGSRDLKPEKSLNFSGGITANPLSGLTLTVDYYNIRIRNRIVLTENLGASGSGSAAINTAVGALITAAGFPSVGAARFFINGLDTRTQGVDAVASWRLPVDFGRFNLTAAYNYNDQKILKYRNDLGPLATIPGLVLFGRTESLRFTRGQPRDKVVLSLDGDIAPFGFTVRSTRYGNLLSPGSVAQLAPNTTSLTALGPDDVKLSAKWITDIELRFDATDRIHLAVGADNAFDVYPDRLPFGLRPAAIGGAFPQNQQYNPYSGGSPFGFNGRFRSGRVAIDF